MPDIRIASWNTLWRFGEWRARQDLLAEHVAELNADVLLLQETWPEQTRALAAAAGLQVLGFCGGYFDRTKSDVPTDEMFGNAILAKEGSLVLQRAFDGDPRDAAPRCLLAAEVGGLIVATSHLSHIADSHESRATQLGFITNGLAEVDRPYVFAGDCNLIPSSPEHQVAEDLGLTDVWLELRPTEWGATMEPENPEIWGSDWMDQRNGAHAPPGTGIRIDYIWRSPHVAIETIERFGRGRVSGRATDRWPSDHTGLVATVTLPPNQGPEVS